MKPIYKKYDYIIIGSGIIGSSIAYKLKLRNKNFKILILEKESKCSMHQTGNNSNVIHSGIYYKPGSSKAINCELGRKQIENYCKRNNIKFQVTGKLIAARNDIEELMLENLRKRGIQNGLQDPIILNKKNINNIEPNLKVKCALHVKETGITDYVNITKSLISKFLDLGGDIIFNYKAKIHEGLVISDFRSEVFKAQNKIIICAGLQADRVIEDNNSKYKIVPFRGEYYQLVGLGANFIKNIVYPVPDEKFPFLGVHFTKGLNEKVEIGPNALLSMTRENYKNKYAISIKDFKDSVLFKGTRILVSQNLNFAYTEIKRSLIKSQLVKEIKTFFPKIKSENINYLRSGIRAQLIDISGNIIDDFKTIEKENTLLVLNSPSPAATACLAIADNLINKYL